MVKLIDSRIEAIENWDEARKQVRTLIELEKQGIISGGLKRYCNQMITLEGLSEEAKAHALHNDGSRLRECLLDMKKFLIGIKCNYAEDMIKKPALKEFYQELYNLAQERYKDTFNEISETIGGELIRI